MSNLLIDILDLSGVELPDNWKTNGGCASVTREKTTTMKTITAVEFEQLVKEGKITKTQAFSNNQLMFDMEKGNNIYVFGVWSKRNHKVGHFN
jgi:hypothetical protein